MVAAGQVAERAAFGPPLIGAERWFEAVGNRQAGGAERGQVPGVSVGVFADEAVPAVGVLIRRVPAEIGLERVHRGDHLDAGTWLSPVPTWPIKTRWPVTRSWASSSRRRRAG